MSNGGDVPSNPMIPGAPEFMHGEDRDEYMAHVSAWERELEDAITEHIALALEYATARWDEGYAYEYVTGMLERHFAPERPRIVYRKQVIPQTIRTQVFERDMYRCRLCGTHLGLSVDHIIPESRGGTLDIDNLQTLCRTCNSRKGTR